MKTTKIKPCATIVAQFAAGVEIDALIHDNKVYLPVYGGEVFGFTTDEDTTPASTPAPAAPKKEKDTPKKKTYTEAEMMEMDTNDLADICKEMGIDPNKTEGKNTNKKLRLLILKAQEGEDAEEGDEDDEDETPSSGLSGVADEIGALLEDYDAGKKNKKKTIAAILDLGDDVDEDKVNELIDAFTDDADADLGEMANKIAAVVEGKPAAKKSPKKAKEELVDADDLEVGDKVSVYWNDDNKQWFDGEVKSIKKGKITIAYDDGTEEAIDPEVHTKIKRLAD